MARVTCAISGLKFATSYFESLNLPHTSGYTHPIFALDRLALYPYYSEHCLGKLTANDSYLLFLAFIHSSKAITWNYPASCNPHDPATKHLIEANMRQLIAVLEKTDLISHPSFQQPSFAIYYDNSSLRQIPNWIGAWEDNISDFYTKKASQVEIEDLQRLENKLTAKIYSGEPPEKFARIIADWADRAGDFPPATSALWKETIRSCFSITKMFNTPLPLLKEIKDYIECNIPAGSIHFSAIHGVIKEGISKHEDYLGGSSLALGYTLLPTLDSMGQTITPARELKGSAEVATIAAKASSSLPKRLDYPDAISFLKAKLAYRVASNLRLEEDKSVVSPASPASPATASQPEPVLLVDANIALPTSYTEPTELLDSDELEEDYTLDSNDLDGLTITDNLDGEV